MKSFDNSSTKENRLFFLAFFKAFYSLAFDRDVQIRLFELLILALKDVESAVCISLFKQCFLLIDLMYQA